MILASYKLVIISYRILFILYLIKQDILGDLSDDCLVLIKIHISDIVICQATLVDLVVWVIKIDLHHLALPKEDVNKVSLIIINGFDREVTNTGIGGHIFSAWISQNLLCYERVLESIELLFPVVIQRHEEDVAGNEADINHGIREIVIGS